MSDISETEWLSNLISIVEDLDDSQYKRMLVFLTKIPKGVTTSTSKEQMPQKIIEHYGLEESISAINEAMNKIPRKDSKVQDLLRPFVDKLRNKREKKKKVEKRKPDPEQKEKGPATGKKKCDLLEKENRPSADQQKSCQPNKETNTCPWKKSICDLKASIQLGTHNIAGKVVQKSGLRTYQNKDKVKKFFFYVALADETDSIRMMVYGKPYYKQIKEEKYFLFRRLIKDNTGVVEVTSQSVVSETSPVAVPEEIENEARKLIYSESPVCPIADIKSFAEKTEVSVEGTVKEIDLVGRVKVHYKPEKTEKQSFKLSDETDSIWICMWGENTKLCKGLSVGDVIKVTNLKTSRYYETVSLNSAVSTSIHKIQSVGIQNVSIKIIGIIKATKKETQLEAEVSKEVHTFVAASRLLAEAFGFTLDGDIKESLLNKMPLTGEAVIQGSKIKKIKAN